GQRHWNRRRSAAAADIEHPGRARRNVPRGDERLDEQPIDRFRRGLGQIQAGQVDLAVPGFEEAEVGFETRGELRCERDARTLRPPREPILKLAARHECAAGFRQESSVASGCSRTSDSRPRNTPSTATAAGVTPGIREAWPSVSGRTWD